MTIAAAALLLTACGTSNEDDQMKIITRSDIQLESDVMTPEALWLRWLRGGSGVRRGVSGFRR